MSAGEITPGRRNDGARPWDLRPGEYSYRDGILWIVLPNGHGPARLAGPKQTVTWDVVEHEDGSVSASPSILAHADGRHEEWHGYLERGAWREV